MLLLAVPGNTNDEDVLKLRRSANARCDLEAINFRQADVKEDCRRMQTMHELKRFFAVVCQLDFAAFESQKRSSALRDVAIIIYDEDAQVRRKVGRPDRFLGGPLRREAPSRRPAK